jgi:hypothetical protein
MKPFLRILLPVVVILSVQVFPLAAQWVNGPEFNPSQERAAVDKEPYVKMQSAATWMTLAGIPLESVGVYLFVYEACTVPLGEKFHPFEGKACVGLVCFTTGVALLTGSYILFKRGDSGERIIRRIQDPYRQPFSMLTVGPTEHGLGMSYRF